MIRPMLIASAAFIVASCGADSPPETCFVKDGREVIEVQCPPPNTGMSASLDAGADDAR